jgi:hypothetical protein
MLADLWAGRIFVMLDCLALGFVLPYSDLLLSAHDEN